ncbi:MAG: NUDIX domain-containing protein [Patescibacteria group bacterium]|jgi:ADP-ribose pyrophosphatase YjhB (NUDIX family)
MFKVGAFAIIFDKDGKVLLCHRLDYDLWNLPGGGLNDKESPWEAVIRETKEETGLDVEIEKLVGIYSKNNKNDIVFSFKCKVIGGEIALSDEADEIEYFDINSLPKNTVPKQVVRIKDAFADKKEVILKIQGGPEAIELVKQGKL